MRDRRRLEQPSTRKTIERARHVLAYRGIKGSWVPDLLARLTVLHEDAPVAVACADRVVSDPWLGNHGGRRLDAPASAVDRSFAIKL